MKTKRFISKDSEVLDFVSDNPKPLTLLLERSKAMKTKIFTFVVLFLVAGLFAISSAQVPQMINYQGTLTDTLGNRLNGDYNMTFSIYDVPNGGGPLWSEILPGVSLEKGVFNVLLPVPYGIFNGQTRYLGIAVSQDSEMVPRRPIVSVGYAFRSQFSDTALYALAGPGGGGAVNDWTFRITDTADTTLMTVGPWGIARYGNMLYGNTDSTHVNLGVACTTGTGGYNYKYCVIGGGLRNKASQDYTTVGGGLRNTASNTSATVGGGEFNIASGQRATVGGGGQNISNQAYAIVGGGFMNTSSGIDATVGGGDGNAATNDYATVGGGTDNTASGNSATVGGGSYNTASYLAATVGGGAINAANYYYATVGGGQSDTASAYWATVGGGRSNIASGLATTVGGGRSNAASGLTATVGGGYYNRASGDSSTVGGGENNLASGSWATIGGGMHNIASNYNVTIAGGGGNTANASTATVGGGASNTASGYASTVGGGYLNAASYNYTTVGGGHQNFASSYNGTVGGGGSDTAGGDYYTTVAGGYHNNAVGTNATVGGGRDNKASGVDATVGGGEHDTASGEYATVGGGYHNIASGVGATVPGGDENIAAGDRSFAAGYGVNVTSSANNTFAFGSLFTTSTSHAVIFYDPDGIKVGIGTTNPTYDLDVSGNIRATGSIYGNVTNATNADKVDGYHAGNSSGQVPVSNGTLSTNLNADMVDGQHASEFINRISGTVNGADSVNITFLHRNPFQLWVSDDSQNVPDNVGWIACYEQNNYIRYVGFNGDGTTTHGCVSEGSTATILTVTTSPNIQVECTGSAGSHHLKIKCYGAQAAAYKLIY